MAATPMTEAMVTAALVATASKIKPRDADPFRKGDAVVYPAHGVGRIERVGIEEIAGHRLNLIHISFDENQMTLRVPVAQARAAGLRKLASRKQLAEALARVRGRPRASRLMWAKRAQEYLDEDQLRRSWGFGRGGSGPAKRRRRVRQQLQSAQSVRACARPACRRVRRRQPDRQGRSDRAAQSGHARSKDERRYSRNARHASPECDPRNFVWQSRSWTPYMR